MGQGEHQHESRQRLDVARRAADEGDWTGARAIALEALLDARQRLDFETMSGALDVYAHSAERLVAAAEQAATGATIIARGADAPDPLVEGCYLLTPPMIGADATNLRNAAWAGGLAVRALAREPLTRAGKWPVVAGGDVIVRTHVDPPVPLDRVDAAITKDAYAGPAPLAWFRAALARLGEVALESVRPEDPAAHRVDDLLEILSALPDEARVIEALRHACAEAKTQRAPTLPRRRPVVDDPYSF
ncbi:MAG: hypothetical protein ACIARR_04760 [Phycisphaerales bacterium JB059]